MVSSGPLIKWFHPARVETRTKGSNISASFGVVKHACQVTVTAGIFVPAADQSSERGLTMSASVRTRKMVNYAFEGQTQEILMEARSDADVQIVRHTWVYVQVFGWLNLFAK